MSKPRLLVQLDPDRHASLFDAVVATDSDVERLVQYSQVQPDDVTALVHGAIFTRGVDELASTAIFIGGTDVSAGEILLDRVRSTFFGPMRVSVMLDANGANTTAAAAVVAASRHLEFNGCQALVLAGTGPVGQRVALLLALQGANVRVASRQLVRSEATCREIERKMGTLPSRPQTGKLKPITTATSNELQTAMQGVELVIAAGAAGIVLLPQSIRQASTTLRVAIDLNAVPPLGIEGIQVTDKGVSQGDVTTYGAIGIGGTKMKIHKAAIRQLFTRNDLVLDAPEIYEIGTEFR